MGNEAIARGVVEACVKVVTGYPGTPSSEVIMTLIRLSSELNMYVEWAVNERVGFEIAFGAAISGIRSMATMKAPGVNVALDPLISSAYSGVDGGMVVLVADDPGPHTTQTEQDSRWLGPLAKLPILDPSSPQEAKDYTVLGYNLSEKYKLPFILRTTTRVNHSLGVVELGEVQQLDRKPYYKRDPERFVRASMVWNLNRHKWLLKTLEKVEKELSQMKELIKVEGRGNKLIVVNGVSYLHLKEYLRGKDWEEKYTIAKIGLDYPFPETFFKGLFEEKRFNEIIVVEELDPYIEQHLNSLLSRIGLNVKVRGKLSGDAPLVGEYSPAIVANILGESVETSESIKVPSRPPPMCPGCPHRATYLALLQALRKERFRRNEVPIIGDIGCYALSVEPPIEAIWNEHSMGASISIAMGLSLVGIEPVIATIGDSTLYHSGILSLIEAVHKQANILVVVLDNMTVAMTGHQETPAFPETYSGRKTRPIPVEDLLKGVGVEKMWIINPFNFNEAVEVFRKALREKGLRVVVSKYPCALLEKEKKGVAVINSEKCTNCMACIKVTGCPAFTIENGNIEVISDLCNGCGLCAEFCPYDAIEVVK
ncbi:MAG TPA: indolepyruvate ferredoxin oxidoreductase subunit alpha [Thermoproteales archaeon]|nr:indolepyruvate ferredoxin oxidoreductase subunit alpha [Thermoproteales archaeon]